MCHVDLRGAWATLGLLAASSGGFRRGKCLAMQDSELTTCSGMTCSRRAAAPRRPVAAEPGQTASRATNGNMAVRTFAASNFARPQPRQRWRLFAAAWFTIRPPDLTPCSMCRCLASRQKKAPEEGARGPKSFPQQRWMPKVKHSACHGRASSRHAGLKMRLWRIAESALRK